MTVGLLVLLRSGTRLKFQSYFKKKLSLYYRNVSSSLMSEIKRKTDLKKIFLSAPFFHQVIHIPGNFIFSFTGSSISKIALQVS